ncbi:type IIL restriction-modification enzyme MmeI, partial [Gemmata sp. JC717]|uniref:type IIL restriction-modification enzyme MmeI n=1 Tax=Gemmata algarum TaxID=2975278 RepID=UPI00228F2911
LEISIVWVRRGGWNGLYVLDEKPSLGITAYLTPPSAVTGNPYRLKANECRSFQGSNVLGMGFVLTPEEAQNLIGKDTRNKDVLFPYLNGEDLNSRFDQTPTRWVINFFDWPIEKAMEYPDCFQIVEEKVKPERLLLGEKQDASAKGYARLWWQYARQGKELYRTIADLKRVVVVAQVSRTLAFCLAPIRNVFAHKVVVFSFHDAGHYSVLQSCFHSAWAWNYTSTLRTDLSYTPTDCFETFPFPESSDALEFIGESYHSHRQAVMLARKEGLTKTYNRFHDNSPNEAAADIQKLRELHVEMDNAVAAAYGWTDLCLDHGFHETKQGLRYTISEAARREVLARLLRLNHERYADEVKEGLHDTKKKPKAASKPKATEQKATTGATLFDPDDGTFPSTERDSYLCGLVCDLVKADPGLPESAYVDALVIALGYKRHKQLLAGKDRTEFEKLCKATPLASWDAADKIPWGELKNQLVRRKAIEQENQTIRAGPAASEARQSYLATAPELVALLRKALTELRALQAHADPDKAEVLKAFVDDKSQWYVVAA